MNWETYELQEAADKFEWQRDCLRERLSHIKAALDNYNAMKYPSGMDALDTLEVIQSIMEYEV